MPDSVNGSAGRIAAGVAAGVLLAAVLAAQQGGSRASDMSKISREYVRLVLALGVHDKDYVDAYYGPDDIKKEAEAAHLTLDAIGTSVDSLVAALRSVPVEGGDELA